MKEMPELTPSESTPPSSPFSIEPLAQLGAVTGRFVHDLANEISCAATVLSLIQEVETDGSPSKEDLDELNSALERSVTMIHHFGATVRTLRPPPAPVSFEVLRSQMDSLFKHYHASLTVDVPAGTSVLCHPEWLMHCVDYAVQMAGTSVSGAISLVPAGEVALPADFYSIDKPTHFFRIAVTGSSPAALPDLDTKKNEDIPLFVTRELLRHMRGFWLRDASDTSLYFACIEGA